jgi:hypothetical protein
MRKVTILLLVIVVVAGAFFLYWYRTAKAGIGNLNIYSGSVVVLQEGKSYLRRNGDGVRVGDTLKVGEGSRAAIVLKDGSVVRLEAGSEVRVSELVYEGQNIRSANFFVRSGKAWSKVKPLSNDAKFEVETPSIVAAVRGTVFNTQYLQSTHAVFVSRGNVAARVKGTEGAVEIPTGRIAVASDPAVLITLQNSVRILAESEKDDWIKFNEFEDAKLSGFDEQTPEITPSAGSGLEDEQPQQQPAPPRTSRTSEPTPSAPNPSPPASVKTLERLSLSYSKNNPTANDPRSLPTFQFTAVAHYTDKTTANVTKEAAWSVAGSAGGSINSSGYYAPRTEGTATITANFGGRIEQSQVNIP